MARLEAGQPAPDFSLPADDGSTVSLSDLAGTTVVLYFYPKDDTPGCTTQACGLRDMSADYDAAGVRVIGVSPDPVASHVRFRDKHDLPFTLLSDADHAVAEAYGVWVEKSMYGKTYMGVERSTFVIGPDGVLKDALYKVKPKGHAASVLELATA
ncbi:thioredoxin-dependent thiol peroxidase [Miltoncostaea oceani]|jgi:thioredoxin-dependent peroxiredoxin|uniref:thioredoxin-dependent thiol peroxidase n=1 Tax=Miltoncostaea oceani TaxID=2843216 RepID=UPI001C3D8E75|nr:thioredoxin-dependent thiol peroxidase [Miltoncostaea oceani]